MMITTTDTAKPVPSIATAVFTDCPEELESKILFKKKTNKQKNIGIEVY
jgi:hypothetical protein